MIILKIIAGIVAIVLFAIAAYKALIVEYNDDYCDEECHTCTQEDDDDEFDYLDDEDEFDYITL